MESFHHLFPFKSYFHFRFLGRHLSFRCRPMSGRDPSAISKSDMVDNVGVAVGIASPYVSVQKLFPLPVFTPDLTPTFEFPVSADVAPCRQCHI